MSTAAAPTLTWLYAVAAAGCVPPPGLTGVAGEELRAVTAPGLTALAGAVPRAEFDEEPLRARLADPDRLEHAVRAHHHVVDALARTAPVLPMRFASLYRDDARAAVMLREHREELLAALDRVTDRVEWGVKAYARAAEPPAEPPAGPVAGAARPGTDYLLRRQARQHRREATEQRAAEDALRVHTALAGAAAGAARHPLQRADPAGHGGPMVLNGAYLVERTGTGDFHAAVDALSARFPGLLLETTGPWPPYSFTTARTGEGSR